MRLMNQQKGTTFCFLCLLKYGVQKHPKYPNISLPKMSIKANNTQHVSVTISANLRGLTFLSVILTAFHYDTPRFVPKLCKGGCNHSWN